MAFRRFAAIWTPSVIVLDFDGAERWRIEGYLPRDEFFAQLKMALARLRASRKRWADAEPCYARVIEEHPGTTAVPEAIYWRGISQYRQTNDHAVLEALAQELSAQHPESVWTIKASVWRR